MNLTKNDIESPRTPADLDKFVKDVICDAISNNTTTNQAILKKDDYKPFFEEVVPVNIFAKSNYPPNYQIEPKLDNQSYDAIVYDADRKLYEYLEIAYPHDGKSDSDDNKKISAGGIGEVRVGEPGHEFDTLIPCILATANSKAQKEYGDQTTLVIVINPTPAFPKFKKDEKKQLEELIHELKQIPFNAKRVFLLKRGWQSGDGSVICKDILHEIQSERCKPHALSTT